MWRVCRRRGAGTCGDLRWPSRVGRRTGAGVTRPSAEELARGLEEGRRSVLARAITLCESTRPDDRALMADALRRVPSRHSAASETLRVGFSGPPGAGKSTLIEALGMYVLDHDAAVDAGGRADGPKNDLAVLAVDPSSKRSGGSVLGDKTRMQHLSMDPRAYVRPSPSRGSLGGVTAHTAQAIAACESAGFSRTFVETVGVGQSETAAEQVTDVFVLVTSPAVGDELQAIKKGIVELADVVVINKYDGALKPAVEETYVEYSSGMRILRAKHGAETWRPRVVRCSALEQTGMGDVWGAVCDCHAALARTGALERRRREQDEQMMWALVQEAVMDSLHANPRVRAAVPAIEAKLRRGDVTAAAAADMVLSAAGVL